MTKIYVVKTTCLENSKDSRMAISAIFSNKRKAEAYRDYWNSIMKDDYHYWISTYELNNEDYTFQLNALKKHQKEG